MKRFLLAAVVSAFVVGGAQSQAATLYTYDFFGSAPPPVSGNDCAGRFGGTGGTICDVGFEFGVEISPIVAKYDTEGAGAWTFYEYGSLDGTEFSGSFLTSSSSSGNWAYSPGDQDPTIRFWVAKGGNGFRLHWMVEDTDACGTVYSIACLQAAVAVTGGNYATPEGAGLSHLSFYNEGPGGDQVPEPATLALFGLGLLGAGIARRRRQ